MSNSNVPNYLGTGYGPAVEDDNLSQILDGEICTSSALFPLLTNE